MLKINGKTITGVVYKGKRIQRIMVGGKKYYDMYDGKIIGNALEAGSVSIGGKTYSYGAGYFELNIGELSVGSLSMAFSNKNLSTITHIGIDTRRVTYMNGMFQGCSSLTSINLGDKFDTSNVTNMSGMFYQCSALSTLDLGDKFDAGKVINVNDMFWNCSSLKTITGCIKNLSISLNLSSCPLDHDSALRIINGLATVTTAQTLTLRSTTKSTLSATEKAVLINKGWTLA